MYINPSLRMLVMAAAKKQTKQDLENKIAELEAKLNSLSTQLSKPAEAAKPAETKPAEVAKPAETAKPKPAETKPAETAKPKPTLPKGTAEKPAETPKPAETKPTQTTSQPPATVQDALEAAYSSASMTDFHQYRAKVTGYSPAPNRYFVRMTAPVGRVPTSDWNLQKAKVTGYTANSNQYYATRARLAYHPTNKRFGTFSGVNMSVDGVKAQAQVQTQTAPPPPPPKPKGTLPKGVGDSPSVSANVDDGKSKKQSLEDYEADYLKRLEQKKIDDAKAAAEAAAAEAKAQAAKAAANKKAGALPKGFEPATAPEPAKSSRGTLPKGF